MKSFTKIVALFVFILSVNWAFSQPINDAIILADKFKDGTIMLDKDAQIILYKYGTNDDAFVKNAFKANSIGSLDNNPFFDLLTAAETANANEVPVSNTIPGVSAANFADGLAKFLVERTKKELNTFFFKRFKEKLNEIDELKVLFPKTRQVLNTIDDQIYNWDAYLHSLREAFVKDLSNLLVSFPELLETNKYKEYFKNFPEFKSIIQISFYTMNDLLYGTHPGDIMNNLVFEDRFDEASKNSAMWFHNLSSSIYTLDLISQSLRADTSEQDSYWASRADITKVLNDKKTFKIFLGLVYAKYINDYESQSHEIIFKGSQADYDIKTFFKAIADDYDNDYAKTKEFIRNISNHVLDVQSNINQLKKIKKENPEANEYELNHKLFNSVVKTIDQSLKVFDLPYIEDQKILTSNVKSNIHTFLFTASTTSDLYLNINHKSFGAAVSDVVSIADTVLSAVFPKVDATVGNDAAKKAAKKSNEASNKAIKPLKEVLKYGSFISSVAVAETSDEVAAAIEAAALPPGSYSIKRQHRTTVSLNGYLGLFGGFETFLKRDGNNTKGNFSLVASIGPEVSWGSIGKKNNTSMGFYIPIIDVGAFASFRFKDSETNISPDAIDWNDIFAPGLYWVVGLPKAPLTLTAGAQVGSGVHKIEESGEVTKNPFYVKYGIGILVDIPILNLYTREK